MNPVLQYVLGYIDSLPQESFDEIRAKRAAVPETDIERQRRLSHEDRRAFAREQVQNKGMLGAIGMGVAIPAEQVAKAAVATPGLGPVAERVLSGLGLSASGRSGFHDPAMAISAGYSGILQGLDDNGLSAGVSGEVAGRQARRLPVPRAALLLAGARLAPQLAPAQDLGLPSGDHMAQGVETWAS